MTKNKEAMTKRKRFAASPLALPFCRLPKYPRYPGTIGKTHGEKKLNTPASIAALMDKSIMRFPPTFITYNFLYINIYDFFYILNVNL